MFPFRRAVLAFLIALPTLSLLHTPVWAQQAPPIATAKLPAGAQSALNAISPDALRGRLSFLASDLLEGRDTPSRGLDIAAEYIASEFRRAGLEPVGDEGYFQNAPYTTMQRDLSQMVLTVEAGSERIRVSGMDMRILSRTDKADVKATRIVKVSLLEPATWENLTAGKAEGSIVCAEYPDFRSIPQEKRANTFQALQDLNSRIAQVKPALILFLDRNGLLADGRPSVSLRPPNAGGPVRPGEELPTVAVHSDTLARWYDNLPADASPATIAFVAPAPTEQTIRLRNVVGLLRGSDPVLKDTYILVTAHYDHIGIGGNGTDRIYNGANDDGSGTVSVMEIASALAKLPTKPKRSILFMTFFGEEKGLLGSRYYGRNPIFPLEKTIAQINLEQVGRTDDTEGPRVGAANLTGFDYSDVGTYLQRAGALTGIRLEKHPMASDEYFARSDNQALADVGVPAHTVSVAYAFPDYHQVGDHWDKIDYPNMAKVARMTAAAVILMGNSPTEPRWNANSPRAARYLKTWQERHAKAGGNK